MKRLFAAISVCILTCLGPTVAQTGYATVGDVLNEYLAALTDTSDLRLARLKVVAAPEARLASVITRGAGVSLTVDDATSYAKNTKPYFVKYIITFEETYRTVSYYADMATVHSIVEQHITDPTTGKSSVEKYWLQTDMVYVNNRWFITSVVWTNQLSTQPIQEAVVTDTLWHRILR
ncbi:MAG: hypothetical protein Kow0075_15170 [Salibacteraceae bacterium]